LHGDSRSGRTSFASRDDEIGDIFGFPFLMHTLSCALDETCFLPLFLRKYRIEKRKNQRMLFSGIGVFYVIVAVLILGDDDNDCSENEDPFNETGAVLP
jgi:hypothetical protein